MDPDLALDQDPELEDAPEGFVEAEAPEQDRQTLTETFEEEGVLAGLGQTAQSFLPQVLTAPTPDWTTAAQDFVNFSAYGDVQDVKMAADPDSDLDPLERAMAWAPAVFALLGAGLIGGGVVRAIRHANSPATSINPSMTPAPGQPWTIPPDAEGAIKMAGTGPDVTAEQFRPVVQAMSGLEHFDQAMGVSTWEDLARVVNDRPAHPELAHIGNPTIEANLRYIGAQIVREMGPDKYGLPFVDGSAATADQQAFVAAQFAVAKWKRAEQLKLLPEYMDTIDVILRQDFSTPEAAMESARQVNWLVQLEVKTAAVGIGPDLNVNPGQQMVEIIVDPTTEKPLRVTTGLTSELLPTERIWDDRTGRVNRETFNERYRRVDPRTLTSEQAANIALSVERMKLDPEEAALARSWYARANATAKTLAAATGRPVSRVAAIFAQISPRTRWAPDNIVTGTHVILRYSFPDLDPNSPEYKQMFKDAINAGGWGMDLFRQSNTPLRHEWRSSQTEPSLFDQNPPSEIDQAIEYWADINNLEGSGGSVRGLEMGSKQLAVNLLLFTELPWWMVLRTQKVHYFADLIAEPNQPGLAVMDAWQWDAMNGTALIDNPVFNTGTRDIDATGAEELVGGRVINSGDIETARQVVRDFGLSDKMVEAVADRLNRVPSDQTRERYQAGVAAHIIAADAHGLDAAHEAQAMSWTDTKTRIDRFRTWIRSAKQKGNPNGIDALRRRLTWNPSVMRHLQGNPDLDVTPIRTLAAIEPNPVVRAPDLDAVVKEGSTGNDRGTGILIERTDDGTAAVTAAPEVRGVEDMLRHAFPVFDLGEGWYPYTTRSAQEVPSIDEVAKALAGQFDGDAPIAGQVRIGMSGSSPTIGRPGNKFVLEIPHDQLADITEILDNFDMPVSYQVDNVQFQQTGVRQGDVDLDAWSAQDLNGPRSPVEKSDWYAISAYTEDATPYRRGQAHERLRKRLTKLGVKFYESEGRYGYPEPSFFVVGSDYKTAMKLAEEFKQESVATRHGLLYSDGTMRDPSGENSYGRQAINPDEAMQHEGDYTLVTTENGDFAFNYGYDWDEAAVKPMPEDPDTLRTDNPGYAEARKQVTVDLGEGEMDWSYTDLLWRRLSGHRAVKSLSAHVHGEMWRPPGSRRVQQRVYTDPTGRTLTWRTQQSGHADMPHMEPVFVPEWEAYQMSQSGDTFGTKKDWHAAWREASWDSETGYLDTPFLQVHRIGDIDNPDLDRRSPLWDIDDSMELEFGTGAKPILRRGEAFQPRSGLVIVQASGDIWAENLSDAAKAKSLLDTVGYSTQSTKLGLEQPDIWSHVAERIPVEGKSAVKRISDAGGWPTPPPLRRDVDAQLELGIVPMFELGQVATEAHVRQVVDTIQGLRGKNSVFADFNATYGSIPDWVFNEHLKGGIRSADTHNGTALAFVQTELNTKDRRRILVLGERTFVGDRILAGRAEEFFRQHSPKWFSTNGATNSSVVVHSLVHELGHVIEGVYADVSARGSVVSAARQVHKAFTTRVGYTISQLGGRPGLVRRVSGYAAAKNTSETWAEMFAQVVLDPDSAAPEVKALVADVMKSIQPDGFDIPAHRQWGPESVGFRGYNDRTLYESGME